MHATTADLTELNKSLRSEGPLSSDIGWAVAFLRICKLLEPNLLLDNERNRVQWMQHVATLEMRLAGPIHPGTQYSLGIRRDVFVELEKIAISAWRGPSKNIRELAFVRNTELRAMAERDLASATTFQKMDETKAVLILAGSVIEAILFDLIEYFTAIDSTGTSSKVAAIKAKYLPAKPHWKEFKPADNSRWTLEQAVVVCGPEGLGILGDRTAKMADVVRDFRNFVHPRKERTQILDHAPLVPSDSVQVVALMESIIDQVRRWRLANP